jgi:hypothetical protein
VRRRCALTLYSDGEIARLVLWTTMLRSRLMLPLPGSIDMKSMQAEHRNDIVPPSTHTLNYIALCYPEFTPEIMVSAS